MTGDHVAVPEGRHAMQCYGADTSELLSSAGRYLAAGAAQGESVLIVARAAHAEALLDRVRRGAESGSALEDDRIAALDARATLDAVTPGGQPDPDLFEAVVGGAVRRLQAARPGARVRAYGEKVGLLWEGWKFDAAIRLEGYWNRLLARHDVSLFCAYPIDVFGLEFDPEILHPVLSAHTELLPGTAGDLDGALDRAVSDVLGPDGSARVAAAADARWGRLPAAEAKVLWIRAHLPSEQAQAILQQARRHCEASQAA